MSDLWKLSDDKLIDLLFTEEDRLTRLMVEEFLRRKGLVERLAEIVADPYNWNEPIPAWLSGPLCQDNKGSSLRW